MPYRTNNVDLKRASQRWIKNPVIYFCRKNLLVSSTLGVEIGEE